MDTLFLLLFVLNGIIIGTIIAAICKHMLGEQPVSRLIRLLASVIGGIVYFVLCYNIGFGYGDITFGSLLIMFFPIVLMIIKAIINYMYKK